MKNIISIVIFVIMATIVSPDILASPKKNVGKKKSTPTVLITKGEVNTYGDGFTTQLYTAKKGKSYITVEYPLSGPQAVVTAIRNFEKMAINEKFNGSLDTPDELLTSAIRSIDRSEELEETVKVIFSSSKVVTVHVEAFEWVRGVPAGFASNNMDYGKTFFIADGSTFNSNMLPSFKLLRPYVVQQFDEYEQIFCPDSDFEFEGDENVYFNSDGLVINFSPYESWEMDPSPEAIIPYEIINHYISVIIK